MSGFINNFFGPLNKDSCYYFLIMSILFFVVLVLVLFSEIIYIFSILFYGKKFDFTIFNKGVMIIFNLFIVYFVNRLLYTMCSTSLA
jgi:hypothetical protein